MNNLSTGITKLYFQSKFFIFVQEQWTEKQKVELNNLEKKFQKNLEKLGDGHTAAMKVNNH
jgi:hypothetical protein